MDKREDSALENRTLAKKPIFIKDNQLNLDFGKDFNSWFNDRFNTRKGLIKTNVSLRCILNFGDCEIGEIKFNKKYNVLYRDNFWGMPPIVENKDEVLTLYAANLNKFQKYCDDKNISLYLLYIPRQSDFLNFDITEKRKHETDPAEEVIDYLKDNTKTKIIYPKQELFDANKITPVYFKTDHHWTKKGAYVSYVELIKIIKKDFPDVQILEENSLEKYYDKRVSPGWNIKLNPGLAYKQMGLPKFYQKRILDTDYLYYKNPQAQNLKEVKNEFTEKDQDSQFYYPTGANEKIIVIGDSFGFNFFEFMPYSFKDSLFLFNNVRKLNLKNYKKTIETYKPRILVLLFYTPDVPKLLDLYSSEPNNEEEK